MGVLELGRKLAGWNSLYRYEGYGWEAVSEGSIRVMKFGLDWIGFMTEEFSLLSILV